MICPLGFEFKLSLMSTSTYAPTIKVPEGFPELLAELTTEVLREQPEDATGIYRCAYDFFLKKQNGGNDGEQGDQGSEEAQNEA